MLKVFDKAFAQTPFFVSGDSILKTQDRFLFALKVLLCVSVINFGLVMVIHFLIAYITAFSVVWMYSFFNRSVFFTTKMWQSAVYLYVFFLPAHVSILNNIFGILIVMCFGVGVLSVQGRPIISPVLLGITATLIISLSQQDYETMTLTYLLPLLHKHYQLIGEGSLVQLFLDANLMIAGLSEHSLLYKENLSTFYLVNAQYKEIDSSISFYWKLLSNPYVYNMGLSSILSLVMIYIYLGSVKIIEFTLPIIYVLMLGMIRWGLLSASGDFSFQSIVLEPMLWGVSILLFAEQMFLPNSYRGRVFFVGMTATVTGLLVFRAETIMNYLFALMVTSFFGALIELSFRKKIFGFAKTTQETIISYSAPRVRNTIVVRSVVFCTMLYIIWLMGQYFFTEKVKYQESRYYQRNILKLFDEKIVYIEPLQEHVFKVIDINNANGLVLYSEYSLYRNRAEIFLLIQENTIKDIQVLALKTAHFYPVTKSLGDQFINMDVSQAIQLLQISQSKKSSRSLFVEYIINEAILNGLIKSEAVNE